MKSEITSNNYEPNQNEKFMNKKQLKYFKNRLLEWKKELLKADVTDRASLESDRSLELRTRDRARKLLSKINKALLKIEDGTYGYCEETMEPISIERLKARPIATLTLEAQENHEK